MTTTEGAQQTDAGATGGTQPGSSTPPASDAGDQRTLSQEQVNAILAEEKRKWKAQQDAAAEAAARKAAEDAAAKSGEWEKLATERAAERDRYKAEHATLSERLAALTEVMERHIKDAAKALPEELRALIPDGADVLTRYDLVQKAAKAAEKLQSARTPGTPPGPRGAGARAQTAPDTDILAQKRARIGGL